MTKNNGVMKVPLPFLLPVSISGEGASSRLPRYWTYRSWDGTGFGYVAYSHSYRNGRFRIQNMAAAEPEMIRRHERWMRGRSHDD